MAIKSISDITWKDSAVIEVRSLIARLEGIAGADRVANSVVRQAVRLADLIDHIVEQPAGAVEKSYTVHYTVKSPKGREWERFAGTFRIFEEARDAVERVKRGQKGFSTYTIKCYETRTTVQIVSEGL
jgi:uncharacterized membrane protein